MRYIATPVFLLMWGLLPGDLTPIARCQVTPPSKVDAKSLEGTWSLIAYTLDGLEAPEKILQNVKVTIEKGKFTLEPMPVFSQYPKLGKSVWEHDEDIEAKVELGSSGGQKTINLIIGKGHDSTTLNGIYRFMGGTLQTCLSLSDSPPMTFESKKNSMNRLLHLKKLKP